MLSWGVLLPAPLICWAYCLHEHHCQSVLETLHLEGCTPATQGMKQGCAVDKQCTARRAPSANTSYCCSTHVCCSAQLQSRLHWGLMCFMLCMNGLFCAWWCRFKKGGRGWSNPEKVNRKGSADGKAKAELRTPQQVRFLTTFIVNCFIRGQFGAVRELEPRCRQQEAP